MDSHKEAELDARLARVEASIAELQQSVATLLDQRGQSARRAPSPEGAAPPASGWERDWSRGRASSSAGAGPRRSATDEWGQDFSSWFSSRAPEWWLSRLGIAFVVLAVLFLYGYAIDKGWITPPVRVLAGAALGAGLFWLAMRASRPADADESSDLGMRDLLYGGALAVWYITAYAAAVWYQLIGIPIARVLFFALAILSTWIALQEKREIFALIAVAAGFATPFILPAPVRSIAEVLLYLGFVTAMGLIVYLLRGWHSIIWITFVGFWLSIVGATDGGATRLLTQQSPALTALLVFASAAFVRVPSLRRDLLLTLAERYTPVATTSGIRRLMEGLDSLAQALGGGKSDPDSLVFWLLPLMSPILAINFLAAIWPGVPKEAWGFALLLMGAAAFALTRRGEGRDRELTHLQSTAAALWVVLSLGRIVFSPESIPLGAIVATVFMLSAVGKFAGVRTVAKAAIAIALTAIVGHELSFAETGLLHLRWVLSGIATIGCASLIAQALIADPAEKKQGIVLAVAAYLAGLVLLWRMLEPVWPPLVTTSYALLGATLLVASRRLGSNPMLRRLGGVTMIVVVVRLLLVDMASVETIWRVLLFLVCGALFLYTGYKMQPAKPGRE